MEGGLVGLHTNKEKIKPLLLSMSLIYLTFPVTVLRTCCVEALKLKPACVKYRSLCIVSYSLFY